MSEVCEATGITKPECACVECVTTMLRQLGRWRSSVTDEPLPELDATARIDDDNDSKEER